MVQVRGAWIRGECGNVVVERDAGEEVGNETNTMKFLSPNDAHETGMISARALLGFCVPASSPHSMAALGS